MACQNCYSFPTDFYRPCVPCNPCVQQCNPCIQQCNPCNPYNPCVPQCNPTILQVDTPEFSLLAPVSSSTSISNDQQNHPIVFNTVSTTTSDIYYNGTNNVFTVSKAGTYLLSFFISWTVSLSSTVTEPAYIKVGIIVNSSVNYSSSPNYSLDSNVFIPVPAINTILNISNNFSGLIRFNSGDQFTVSAQQTVYNGALAPSNNPNSQLNIIKVAPRC